MSERRPFRRNGCIAWIIVAWLWCASGAPAGEMNSILEILDEGRLDEATRALIEEVKENPADEARHRQRTHEVASPEGQGRFQIHASPPSRTPK